MTAGVNYREYIASDAWKQRRAEALRRASVGAHVKAPACEACGAHGTRHKNKPERGQGQFRVEWSNGLEVHHLHYRTIGHESPQDLIVLCWDCHTRVHEDPAFTEAVLAKAAARWAT